MNELYSEIIYTIETYSPITYEELLNKVDYKIALVTKEAFLNKIGRLFMFGIIGINAKGFLEIRNKNRIIFLLDELIINH